MPHSTPTQVRCGWGRGDDVTVKVKFPARTLERVPGVPGVVLEGTVAAGWARAAIYYGRGGRVQMFVIEPASSAGQVAIGGFYVRGQLKVVEKIANTRKAIAAWEAFEPR